MKLVILLSTIISTLLVCVVHQQIEEQKYITYYCRAYPGEARNTATLLWQVNDVLYAGNLTVDEDDLKSIEKNGYVIPCYYNRDVPSSIRIKRAEILQWLMLDLLLVHVVCVYIVFVRLQSDTLYIDGVRDAYV